VIFLRNFEAGWNYNPRRRIVGVAYRTARAYYGHFEC